MQEVSHIDGFGNRTDPVQHHRHVTGIVITASGVVEDRVGAWLGLVRCGKQYLFQ
ncbi:hypothetical protein ACFO1V_05825 [Daeguia caeni]|uniref:Uncharacterized protein n=1 Tax=Daeguia caeni TaxID=439612 RepID=A0ABV9H4K9_9HYPH